MILNLSFQVVLVGLLTSTPATPPAAPPPACSLLTQAQVDTALGVSAKAGQGTAKVCTWAEAGAAAAGRKKNVVVTVQDATAFASAKAPGSSANVVKTPASGIGDDAVYATVTGVTTTLTVKKGDAYFEVHVYGFPDAQTRTLEKSLALNVIAKLQ